MLNSTYRSLRQKQTPVLLNVLYKSFDVNKIRDPG